MHREEIHWDRTAPAAPARAQLKGHVKTDVLIVGAGLAGLRTAITLAENGPDTAVIDAQKIGLGASGRSGGQCNPIWRATPDDLRRKTHGAMPYDKTPATKITRQGAAWHVETPEGSNTADTVILTTNAYTDNLWPKLRQSVLPLVSIAIATAPLTPEQQATVLPGRKIIPDTRTAIYFARYNADNRVVFGCVGSSEAVGILGGHGRLRTGLHTVFPQLKDIDIECAWGGRIGVTQDMISALNEPAPGILAVLGLSGRGIAMTSVMGRCLARKVLGGANSDLPFPVSPLKPIPFHEVSRRLVLLMAPTLSFKDKASVIWDRTVNQRD